MLDALTLVLKYIGIGCDDVGFRMKRKKEGLRSS